MRESRAWGTRLGVGAILLALCTGAAAVSSFSKGSVAAQTQGAAAAVQAFVPSGVALPEGLRAAAYDHERGLLWVLTRTNSLTVQLAAVDDRGVVRQTFPLAEGDRSWGGGAVDIQGDLVWVAWGQSVKAVRASDGAVARSLTAPWPDSTDDSADRIVSMAASGDQIWVVAQSQPNVWAVGADDRWASVPIASGQRVGPFTRLVAYRGGVAVNLGSPLESPAWPTPVEGLAWTPPDAVVVGDGVSAAFVSDQEAVSNAAVGPAALPVLPSVAGLSAKEVARATPTALSTGRVVRVLTSLGKVTAQWVDRGDRPIRELTLDLPTEFAPVRDMFDSDGMALTGAAPKINAVTPDGHGGVWVVTQHGGENPPEGLGPLLHFPFPPA